MESIRQGADNNSKSLQANGLRQSHLEYNTARKIIGEIIGGYGNHGWRGGWTLLYRPTDDSSKLTNKFSHLSSIEQTLSPPGRRI